MRYKIHAIFLLALMVFYLVKPVIPFIDYAINQDFIAKNLCVKKDEPNNCCKGKCHLTKQLAKESSETEQNKNVPNKNLQNNNDVKEFLFVRHDTSKLYALRHHDFYIDENQDDFCLLHAFFVPPDFRS